MHVCYLDGRVKLNINERFVDVMTKKVVAFTLGIYTKIIYLRSVH